jgi:hypothetical protein
MVTSGESGVSELFTTLAHELSHDQDTARTHVHGEEFYRRYHDLTIGIARDKQGHRICTPLQGINYFRAYLQKSRIEERYNQAVEKERKEKERRAKKLGLTQQKRVAASVKLCDNGPVTTATVTRKPKRKVSRGLRRTRRLRA